MELKIMDNLRAFISSSRRVLLIAKKPDWKEFEVMAKVTGIGILIIAAIGYVIFLFFAFVPVV